MHVPRLVAAVAIAGVAVMGPASCGDNLAISPRNRIDYSGERYEWAVRDCAELAAEELDEHEHISSSWQADEIVVNPHRDTTATISGRTIEVGGDSGLTWVCMVSLDPVFETHYVEYVGGSSFEE